MSEHTPGPWQVAGPRPYVVYHQHINEADNPDDIEVAPRIRNEADAHLIAEVPALLAACELALRWFDDTQEYGDTPPEWVVKAQAAIAKAKA